MLEEDDVGGGGDVDGVESSMMSTLFTLVNPGMKTGTMGAFFFWTGEGGVGHEEAAAG